MLFSLILQVSTQKGSQLQPTQEWVQHNGQEVMPEMILKHVNCYI